MKTSTVETVAKEHGPELVVRDVRIGSETYDLRIRNVQLCLSLSFCSKKAKEWSSEHSDEFLIDINEKKGVLFSRCVRRPFHDHDDVEYLQIKNDTSQVVWRTRFPYVESGYDFFTIDFGSIILDY